VGSLPAAAASSVAVRLGGYIQADGVLYDQASQDEVDPSNGAVLNGTRYLIRRARVHLDIDHTRMTGSLEFDANTVNGASAGIIDAEVTVRARARDDGGRPWGEGTIGLVRIPWGYEISQRDQDRFFLEAIPSGGPAVVSVFNSLTAVESGERDKPLNGTVEPSATAVALGLRGDLGYWIVLAGPPALDAPDLPTFVAKLSFSPALPLGTLSLIVRAVDDVGHFGPPSVVPLASAPLPPPIGTLVVTLSWDTEADLDLHVVTPDGTEIWARNINSYRAPPPGTAVDPSAWKDGGILDFDSNAGCVIDGRRQENVVWQAAPPPGTYRVRVDTSSLCGAPAARWIVDVIESGARMAASQGLSLPTDARFSKGPGSGLEALTFDVLSP
jgi:hypothetical protein